MNIVPKNIDFRLKMFIDKFFGILPYRCYRFFVRRHPKLRNQDYKAQINQRINNLKLFYSNNLTLKNKKIVETGTGVNLKDPILFYLSGSNEIHTFDLHLHYEKKHIYNIIDKYKGFLKNISSITDEHLETVEERWNKIKHKKEEDDITGLFETANIYTYESKIIPTEIKKGEIDIFYSHSVLQRVSFKWLRRMINDASKILKGDAIFWHKIDCNDINSMYDPDINRYHYLKYSDSMWNLMTTEGINNQNRLRKPDYVRLFINAGFHPIYIKYKYPKKHEEMLESIDVDKKFKKYDIEELKITNFKIIAGRGKYIRDE